MAPRTGTDERGALLSTTEKPKASLNIKPRDLGVKVLAEGEDGDDLLADVVAIHGFGARPETAWTHEGESKKVNWLADEAKKSIPNIAIKLLSGLVEKRRECQRRPIVFVGHCLGGLIALKAYTIARVHAFDYPHIYDSITGLLSLGTPYQGFSIDKGLHKMFEQIARSQMRTESSLVDSIAQNNDVLVSVVHEFTREINTRAHPPLICCFFEEQATSFGAIAGVETELEFVVDESSGTLNGHRKIGLTLGHFNISKFEDNEDDHYQSVSSQIRDMVDKSKEILEGRGTGSSSSRSVRQQYAPSATLPFKEEPNFIARGEILQRMGKMFDKTEMIVLCGGTGIGKTHIAIKYAHEFDRDFPGSKIHWVNAQSAVQFELSYRFIAGALNLSDTGNGVIESVHHHLRRDCAGRWLMVLDGLCEGSDLMATSGSHEGQSLLKFVPKCHNGKVLATTRSRALANRLARQQDSNVIDVPALEDGDAARLLLGSVVEDAAKLRSAALVAKELGHSPVALTLAGAFFDTVKKMPLGRYLSMITSQQHTSSQGTKEEVGVRRAWQPLYDDLNKKYPETARLMLLVGDLDLQSIPTSFVAEATADKDVERHIRILVQYGLVEPFVNRTAICVTDMVRQRVREWLVEHNQKPVYEEKVLSLMSAAYPAPEAEEHARCEVLHPCVMAILQLPLPAAVEAKRDRATLLFKVARYLLHLGQHKPAIRYLRDCLGLGIEDPEGVQSVIDEAQAVMDQAAAGETGHQPSSSTVSRRPSLPSAVASLFRATPDASPTEHTHGWAEMYNLAVEQAKRNLHRQAETHYLAAFQAAARLFGSDGYVTLQILGSLAVTKCSLGHAEEGRSILEFVLARQRDTLGPNHPETLVTRHNLALVLQMIGQLDIAGAELQHVLDLRIQLLGRSSPATTQALEHLIWNCQARGMLENAEALRTAALQSRDQNAMVVYGETPPALQKLSRGM